ncbi:MAG: gamma-glutamyltransferase family protein [Lautropia sp.]
MVCATKHNVVAGHYLASQAAFAILENGGNAVDAGVAAGLVLAVVQSDVVNFAGVAPMLIYTAKTRQVTSIAGLGAWPKAMRPDYFQQHHDGKIPHGVLRTVVPAAPDAWLTALGRFGTMTFGEVAREAIRLARDGFVMHPLMSTIISAFQEDYRRWPANAAIYLPNGRPPLPGERFIQRDLAATITYMVDQEASARGGRLEGLEAARHAFYCGDIGAKIAAYHREHGGFLTLEDLAGYRSKVEQPTRASFEKYQIFTCPAWCQGPTLIQILRLADALEVSRHPHNSPAYVHALVEAFKIAFADRHRYFGDPDHVSVPLERLLSTEYARARADAIDREAAAIDAKPDDRPSPTALDTSYVCVVDRQGNALSATPSDVSMDTPVIPGTGICPSSRGSQSWADPHHPSSVAPGKRPRLTPSPALAAMHDGRLVPFGTPGGDVQLQAMAQVFLNLTEFGFDPQAAVDAPRFATYDFPDSFEPHVRLPGRVHVEADLGAGTAEALRLRGHDVVQWPARTWRAGGVCVLDFDPGTGISLAGADPRRPSYAVGA